MAVQGAPVKIVSPCEGTGYEIGSMSIIKGARNLDNAKKWYDWALTAGGAEPRRRRPTSRIRCRRTRRAVPAGEVAEARRDQADQLRLRQIRLVGGAPAAAVQVGQRGEEPAEVSAVRGAPHAWGRGMNRGAQAWVALGWVGFALLPWHLARGEWYESVRRLHGAGGPRSAAGSRARPARAWWLAPIVVPLLLGDLAADRPAARRNRRRAGSSPPACSASR